MNKPQKRLVCVFLSLLLTTTSCAVGSKLMTGSGKGASSASITGLTVNKDNGVVEVVITATSKIQYTAFKVKNPLRLIVDLAQVDISGESSAILVNSGQVKSIKTSYFESANDSRIEITLDGDVSYNIDDSNKSKLRVQIAERGADDRLMAYASGKKEAKKVDEPVSVTPTPSEIMVNNLVASENITVSEPFEGAVKVEDVKFRQMGGLSRIEIFMSDNEPSYELIARKELNRLTLDLPGAVIAKEDENLINVGFDDSLVKNVAAFQFRGGSDPLAKVVVNLEEMTLYDVRSEGNKIILEVGDEAVLALAVEMEAKKEAELVSEPVGKPVDTFVGERISLDFQRADIHNILRIIADVSGYNVITSDSVKGQVTMKLKDVPWDQALTVILKNNGLDMIKEGTIIRVATTAEIQAEKEAQERRLATERKIEPLYTRIFEVNYESASNMQANIESLKSERGSVDINERTNTLIVKDTKAKLAEIKKLISILDKKELQVLIEARIVEVTHQKARELGIQWGGYNSSVLGSAFPNTIGVTGGTGVGTTSGQGEFGVSLPTSGVPMGGIGITLGHINGTALLDARLSALENSGNGRIVSMPKITTMNNKEAIIESGREIPYQTVSSEGTKTEFRKATLSLKVTPHVTPDRHVRLNIETHKDEPDFSNQLPGAPPPILTKQAKTEVLVADGDTTVIGGLFKDTNSSNKNQVPWFGDIPFLGWLFKTNSKTNSGEQLLIFITPKVLE